MDRNERAEGTLSRQSNDDVCAYAALHIWKLVGRQIDGCALGLLGFSRIRATAQFGAKIWLVGGRGFEPLTPTL